MAVQVGVMSRCIKSLDGLAYTNRGRNLKVWSNFTDYVGAWYPWDGIWYDVRSGLGTDSYPMEWIAEPGRHGVFMMNTGITAVGIVTSLAYGLPFPGLMWGVKFGGGVWTFECDCIMPLLSTAIEEFILYSGYGDNCAAGDMTDGCYFKYDRTVSLNWLAVTANGGVRTITDTGIPVVAAVWSRLRIVVNALCTAAQFFINDILVATNVANLPSGAVSTSALHKIEKTVGINQRQYYIDWTWLHLDLTAGR
jgi:hypothetical protein